MFSDNCVAAAVGDLKKRLFKLEQVISILRDVRKKFFDFNLFVLMFGDTGRQVACAMAPMPQWSLFDLGSAALHWGGKRLPKF